MKELIEVRKEIDSLDSVIVESFIRRMNCSKEIALIKAESNCQVLDKKREQEIIDKVIDSVPNELKDYVKELYETIFSLSKKYQNNIIEKNKNRKKIR